MKTWQCPNCGRKGVKGDKVKMVFCPCGYYMVCEKEEVSNGRRKTKI